MATQTTYYNFNKPAGTDLVNPLTDTIPNWDLADAALHGLSVASIGTATEIVTLGVHALTRVLNPDAKFFQFIATGDYDEGETFTVDGVAIPAATPDGQSLATDCYVTGAVVLASLNADDTLLTIYVSAPSSGGTAADSERLGGELPAYYATKTYADTIKDTSDAAASAIAKKALVNVYYDATAGKLYRVLSDGSQGGEIKMSQSLDWANATNLSGSSLTTSKNGAIVGVTRASSSSSTSLTIGGKSLLIPGSGSAYTHYCIQNVGSSVSISVGAALSQPLYFVPYK